MTRAEIEEKIEHTIEASKAIDTVGEYHNKTNLIHSLTDLFIQLSEEPKWIKLNKDDQDVLPELKDDSVLAHFENGSIETVHIQDFFSDISDGFDSKTGISYTKWYLKTEITHWMKLPKQPSLS